MTALRRSKSQAPLDCIIVGGGASGLAAAAGLSGRGLRIRLLEARERLGGRVWTLRRGLWPIELGAEFVHGEPESTLGVARRAGLRLVEIADDEPRARGRSDFFELIDKVMDRLDPKAPDRPFGDFVAELPHSLRRAGRMAASYVQSFHAADLSLISCADLAEQQKSAGRERANFRLVDGYDRLIDALKDGVPSSSIRTGVVVDEIDWSGPLAVVSAGRKTFAAKTVLVTLPLGVLKSGAVRFSPVLPVRKSSALSRLHMGAAARVVFVFKPEAWEPIRRRLPARSFFQSPGERFPVFWSRFPERTPMITAWVGGPPAAGLGEAATVENLAAGDLAKALRISPAKLKARLSASRYHDWQSDPFSRGSYSYAGVGGGSARKELARPEAGRLFFAGEATDVEGQSATVAGAISSGKRAAKQVLEALKR